MHTDSMSYVCTMYIYFFIFPREGDLHWCVYALTILPY